MIGLFFLLSARSALLLVNIQHSTLNTQFSTLAKASWAVFRKDVRAELRTRYALNALALFAVIAGWARWVEVRLPGRSTQVVTWIWPVCFVLIGVILLNYRES